MQIEKKHLEIVRKILNKHKDIEFYVFGSRSKGTARELSDLDIAIKGVITKSELSNLREDFEESNLPYKVDLVIWDEIDNNFKNNIERDLKLIR